jgi:putative PIN family toxin of toxin-antitoxin system
VAKTRIVPNINVYISGLLWTGVPHQLLQAAESGALTLVTTPTIIDELREVLARPKFAKRIIAIQTSTRELIESLLTTVEIIQDPQIKPVVQQDSDDDKVLACAVAARARWIVSGDDHLLTLKQYKRIRIVTPRAFWESWAKP